MHMVFNNLTPLKGHKQESDIRPSRSGWETNLRGCKNTCSAPSMTSSWFFVYKQLITKRSCRLVPQAGFLCCTPIDDHNWMLRWNCVIWDLLVCISCRENWTSNFLKSQNLIWRTASKLHVRLYWKAMEAFEHGVNRNTYKLSNFSFEILKVSKIIQ